MRSPAYHCLLLASIGLVATSGPVAGGEIRADFLMHGDPDLSAPPPIVTISKKCIPMWMEALKRPEADGQRQAANAIAEAHRLAVNTEETRPLLETVVAAKASHPAARFAAAKTLIAVDAQSSAMVLFEASQANGTDLRQLIEPALAKWRFEPIREIWRARLTAKDTRYRDLILAIRGLGETEDEASAAALLALTHDALRPATVRWWSARSAGTIRGAGLESDSARLFQRDGASLADRLCAVALLQRHDSEAARAALIRLAQDVEPAVAAAALTRLNTLDHRLVVPLAAGAFRSPDAAVRRQGVEALAALPAREWIDLLAPLLDDPHPAVRSRVCEALFEYTKNGELDLPVRQAATTVLAGDGWRGQEQSALLLGVLDHKPVADRLVALLESPRGEVMAATAWALRKFAIPSTLPAMLDKARRQSAIRGDGGVPRGLDEQVAHFCEAFATMHYTEAESLLRQYIPKNFAMGDLSRPAAIWALGHLHAGKVDEELAKLMLGRLIEPPGDMFPEKEPVRSMSAVSLARMRATATAPYMRGYVEFVGIRSPIPSAVASRWAYRELTGEVLPEALPQTFVRTEWFVEPLDPGSTSP